MEEMTFTELQQRMQLKKKKEGTAKYASRHAEDIYNVFKSLKSNWSVVVNYDLVEFSGKTFIKAIATASNREEKEQAVAFAELSPVPILKTRNGDLKQMNEPQWVGAVHHTPESTPYKHYSQSVRKMWTILKWQKKV